MRRRSVRRTARVASDSSWQNKPFNLYKFDDLSTFVQSCKTLNVKLEKSWASADWFGGETTVSAMQKAVSGDSRVLEEAKRMEQKFNDAIDLGLMIPRYGLSAVGAFPCVPAAIQGLPEAMYRLNQNIDDREPVNIYYVVTSSGGCDAKELKQRGIAATALFMAISSMRPCNLYAVSGLGGYGTGSHIVSVKLNSPVNLSQAAFVMSNQGFARGLTYGFLKAKGSEGGWPDCICSMGGTAARRASWAKVFKAGPKDVIFQHPFMSDTDYLKPFEYCQQILRDFKMIDKD